MRTSSVLVAGSPPMRTGLIFAIIALLVAVAATIAVGAMVLRQPTLPPAYGPAGNGLIAYAVDGDIVVTDASGTRRPRSRAGPAIDSMPLFSKDGTRIAFVRSEQPDRPAADGRQRRRHRRRCRVARAHRGPGLRLVADRRPAGAARRHPVGGPTPSVFVAAADGTAWSELDIGDLGPHGWVAWRPPAGDELVFRANPTVGDPAAALYAIAPEGGAVHGRSWSRPWPSPPTRRGLRTPSCPRTGDAPRSGRGVRTRRGRSTAGAACSISTRETNASPPPGAGRRARSRRTAASVVGVGSGLEIEPFDGSAQSRTFGPAIETGGRARSRISPDGTTVLVTEASTAARTLVDIETGDGDAARTSTSEDHPSPGSALALP